jgi:hypothetical protein
MIPPKILYEKIECNEHLINSEIVKDLVYAAYRAKATKKRYLRRNYGIKNWKFATHPIHGIGVGLNIGDDGYSVTKSVITQHSICLGNVVFEYGQVYYWEITINQFSSGINIGNIFGG